MFISALRRKLRENYDHATKIIMISIKTIRIKRADGMHSASVSDRHSSSRRRAYPSRRERVYVFCLSRLFTTSQVACATRALRAGDDDWGVYVYVEGRWGNHTGKS